MEWIHPKTILGSPAERELYLRREYINEEFWRLIETGEHILFVAPRRVGKTSVMKDLEENFKPGYSVKYSDIESGDSQAVFFRRLCEILRKISDSDRGVKSKLNEISSSKTITEIGPGGVKFDKKERDYKSELLALIEVLGKTQIRMVIMLDEFPDVIHAIHKKEGAEVAIDTLQTLRSIRTNDLAPNLSFVFAGSVGLDHIVAALGRPKFINDLRPIQIQALTMAEALDLLQKLIKGATMQIDETAEEYFLQKIGYLLPYYIQLMIAHCDTILAKRGQAQLTREVIDQAYQNAIEEGRNFPDWAKRLGDYLSKADARYCHSLLCKMAPGQGYSIQEAFDLTVENSPETDFKELIDNVLKKDGYVIEEEGRYYFLSPLLRDWWKKQYPEMKGKKK